VRWRSVGRTGHKWWWSSRHPDNGNDRDGQRATYIPADRDVEIIVTSEDVSSFWKPLGWYKRDALPKLSLTRIAG